MKIQFFLFALVISFIACKTETVDVQTKIADLEKAIKASPSPEKSDELIDLYTNLIADNNTDQATKADYTIKAAQVCLSQKRTEKAAKLQAPIEAAIAYQTTAMFDEKSQRIVPKIAKDYVSTCDLFANMFPDHEKAAGYLFEGAEKARILQNYRKAISMFDKILTKYPNSPKAAQSMFLKAFTMDDNLKDYDKAKVIYEAFLAKYPNDDFADDTQFLLKNLGKTDDQIIESFNKK